ncbi:MAG: hypothetical protein QOG83_965, partial [Alphaproteobacteria bacterium]|nr:hypothetical protein [Alphaproteobacteria bacterium]
MASSADMNARHPDSRMRGTAAYALELCIIGAVYFALAKGGLALASIHPSATPIWPPTGLALAAVLLRGFRVWPAILLGAFAANATTAGSLATSAAIGFGNMIEAILGAYLINRWSGGRGTFATPAGVVRFSLISCLSSSISPTIGASSLAIAGFAESSSLGSIWLTWWLGDLAGALLITPVIVLWATGARTAPRREPLGVSLVLFGFAGAIGVIAFSPLVAHNRQGAPLGFLALLPLLWSALRRGPRDTATVALILSCCAVWATFHGGGPFGRDTQNESYLLFLMFMISAAIPSLALSADVAVRKSTEEDLLRAQDGLNRRVDARTAALTSSNLALQDEIDRRMRIETELEQQRVHLAEAQRVANLGSWKRDVAAGTETWSDQLVEIYGLAPGERAHSFEEFLRLVHPEDRERVQQEFSQTLATGEPLRSERRIVRPSGELRYLQSCVEAIKDDHGRVVQLLGICHDITDHREAEIALERTREQLAQVQKMEAIGKLTGGIAHDFNNLLMIVSGHAEMLRGRVSEPKALQGIEAILTASRRGESLTRQLLTFSRRQLLHPVPVDLHQQIEAMRDMLGSSLHGNVSLVIDVPAELWPVEVDVAEFELALVNIAVNARDAMPQGGTFTVSARNVAARQRGQAWRSGDCIELSLRDDGAGIAPDVIKKIFDPFFTTKAVGKGTGLGLSQVYGFASQSRGIVGVTSELGHGTTITLTLPRSRAVVATQGQAPSPAAPGRAEGTILLVEDNAAVGEVTATLLEQIGYQVQRAENAAEALARLQEGRAFDLLFSDIVMPNGMNGVHLAQEVNERYPKMRVLLTTGYSDVTAAAETRFPILRKPFELSALERAVRDAMAG